MDDSNDNECYWRYYSIATQESGGYETKRLQEMRTTANTWVSSLPKGSLLDGLNNVKIIGNEFYLYDSNDTNSRSTETRALFSAARRFTLRDMLNLDERRKVAGVMFPCLEEFRILRFLPCIWNEEI